MKQQFIKEDKVWFIHQNGTNLTTESGNAHSSSLRTSTKQFDTEEACEKDVQKRIKAKTKEGFEAFTVDLGEVGPDVLVAFHQANIGTKKHIALERYRLNPTLLAALPQLTKLESLEISIDEPLPVALGELVKLKKLVIRGDSVNALPDSLVQLEQLEHLEIDAEVRTEGISEVIWQLPQLKSLVLKVPTTITQLPAAIGNLVNLEVLKVYYWSGRQEETMLAVPPEIGQLHLLNTLELKQCNLKALPQEIGLLTNLASLNLEYNQLQDLPDSLKALQKLKTLDLSSNRFEHIPASVCQLKKLVDLDLTWNPLKRIDADFLGLESLEDFDFGYGDTAIENVPDNILDTGLTAIRDFLQNGPAPVLELTIAKAPDNWEELANQRKEAKQEALHDIRKECYKQEKLEEILAFVFGETDQLPDGKRSEIYSFDNLWELFSPVQDWNFIDRRLLTFLCQDTFFYKDETYYQGYYSDFFSKWFVPQLKEEKSDEDLFGLVLQELAPCHIDEWTALKAYLDSTASEALVREDASINSVGSVILKHLLADREQTIALLKEEYYLTPLLAALRHHRDLLDSLLDVFLENYTTKSDNHIRLRFSRFEELCKIDAPAYEPIILKKLAESDYLPSQMETYRILHAYFGEKHHKTLVQKARETLAYISKCKNESGKEQFKFFWSLGKRYQDNTASFIQWVCENTGTTLKNELVNYVKDTKELSVEIVSHIVEAFGQEAIEVAIEALKMKTPNRKLVPHYQKVFKLLNNLDYADYYDEVWKIACSKNSDLARLACTSLSYRPAAEVFSKAQALLSSGKKEERKAGAFILARLNTPEAKKAVQPIFDKEKVDEVRNLVLPVFYAEENQAGISKEAMQQRILLARQRGKLGKSPAKWLKPGDFTALHWKDGSPLTQEEFYYLFYRQSSIKDIQPDIALAPMYNLLDEAQGSSFALELLDKISLKAVDQMCFVIVGKLGDDRIIEPLTKSAIDYQSLNACAILGLMASYEAAKALDKIIRHYKVKYPNVRAAAEEAFAAIAEQLSLTYFELKNRLLPDFGIDPNTKTLKLDNDFQMFIGASLKFEFINLKNKVVKSVPKASANHKKWIKEQKALLTEATRWFKDSLESYLVTQHSWQTQDWANFFMTHPIAFACAQNLIWEMRPVSSHTTKSFIVQANGELMAQDGQVISLENEAQIKLVHPVLLDDSTLNYWRNYLINHQIEQVINQLNREVAKPFEDEQVITLYRAFEGQTQTVRRFKNKARQKGWRRSSIGDGGEVLSYRKAFPQDNVEAFIQTENLPVQNIYDDDDEVTLGKCFFTALGAVNASNFWEWEPQHKDDSRLLPLKSVPAIAFSETMNDLEEILKIN
ncbi:hypothetical protein BKI52_06845 [marine bacterium AO1-C]|nr:hypothetical protein BKI52_06845 [marine bacterium AO1-C]